MSDSQDTDMIYRDVFVDLLFLSFKNASEKNWGAAQVSVYVSLVKECVLRSFFLIENGGALVLEESYREFAKMVRAHSVPTSESPTALFSLLQVVDMIDLASLSFFKHYQSYAKTFTKPCVGQRRPVEVKLSVPRPQQPVPTLEHASNQEDVEEYVHTDDAHASE